MDRPVGASWGGIYLYSGSEGSFDNCTIENVYKSRGGGAIHVVDASLVVEYSKIQYNTGWADGIYLLYSGPYGHPLNIHHNTIEHNYRSGILFNNSSGNVWYNNIAGLEGNDWFAGVYCYYYSDPTLYFYSVDGRNTLKARGYAVRAVHSTPDVGFFNSPWDNAKNRLFGGTYDAHAITNSTIYAEGCWWGENPPDSSERYSDASSIIYFDPWLESDPGKVSLEKSLSQDLTDLQLLLLQGRQFRR